MFYKYGMLFILSLIYCQAFSYTETINYSWSDGQRAGSCTVTTPDSWGLSLPGDTWYYNYIILDETVPNGTVYLNGGGNLRYSISCRGAGTINTDNDSRLYVNGDFTELNGLVLFAIKWTGSYTPTGVRSPCLGLRSTITLESASGAATPARMGMYVNPIGLGSYNINFAGDDSYGFKIPLVAKNASNKFEFLNAEATMSATAEMYKISDACSKDASSLKMTNVSSLWMSYEPEGFSGNAFLSGPTFYLIGGSCTLASSNYVYNLGRWVTQGGLNGRTTPIYGGATPINIQLKCAGTADNVSFRFEDSGSSPTTGIVTLYDSTGTKIDGLGVELLYNGTPVLIDGITETSTGSHGATPAQFIINTTNVNTVRVPTALSGFTARYKQIGEVMRSGSHFTGTVSGRVNFWVTYN